MILTHLCICPLLGLSVQHSGSPVNASFNSLSGDQVRESLKELVGFGKVEGRQRSIVTFVKTGSVDRRQQTLNRLGDSEREARGAAREQASRRLTGNIDRHRP